eukprot:COSAG06_NODE_1006_length_11107_cov_10.602017_14_plen_50_part_01
MTFIPLTAWLGSAVIRKQIVEMNPLKAIHMNTGSTVATRTVTPPIVSFSA